MVGYPSRISSRFLWLKIFHFFLFSFFGFLNSVLFFGKIGKAVLLGVEKMFSELSFPLFGTRFFDKFFDKSFYRIFTYLGLSRTVAFSFYLFGIKEDRWNYFLRNRMRNSSLSFLVLSWGIWSFFLSFFKNMCSKEEITKKGQEHLMLKRNFGTRNLGWRRSPEELHYWCSSIYLGQRKSGRRKTFLILVVELVLLASLSLHVLKPSQVCCCCVFWSDLCFFFCLWNLWCFFFLELIEEKTVRKCMNFFFKIYFSGVDNSVSMLKIFRRKAEDRKLSNCWAPEAFTLSKETIDHLQGRKFDLIVTSLVLHHVADPTETLSMFRLLLKEGGYVVVIDFDVNEKNPHAMGSEEDRKKKGVHHPHGFSVEHMAKIFSSAGLDVIVSSNFQVENKIMLHHPQKDEKIEDGEMSVLAFFGKVHQ